LSLLKIQSQSPGVPAHSDRGILVPNRSWLWFQVTAITLYVSYPKLIYKCSMM